MQHKHLRKQAEGCRLSAPKTVHAELIKNQYREVRSAPGIRQQLGHPESMGNTRLSVAIELVGVKACAMSDLDLLF